MNFLKSAVEQALDTNTPPPQQQQQSVAAGNATHGGAYPAGGGFLQALDSDLKGSASAAASKHAPQDSDLFSDVLGKLLQGKEPQKIAEEDLDEEDAVKSHQRFFSSSSSSSSNPPAEQATSSSLGSAAALEALKLFTSGSGSGDDKTKTQSPSDNSQSAFIGLAMAQAAKLFDKQASEGNVAAGTDKQSVVMKAGEMALKLYLKSHGSGQGAAGGNALGQGLTALSALAGGSAGGQSGNAGQQGASSAGGADGLLGLAGKFLK